MENYNSNYEIAQAINEQIGNSPIPFDSIYSIALNIYQELGGEPANFDSVYSILLDILQQTKESPNIIKDVDTLPNANENKNKTVRLSTNNKLYQSVLVSSEETNRLPDNEQIDKAYIYITDENFVNYYKGVYHIVCNDGETDGYLWYQDEFITITLKNAEVITNDDNKSSYYELGSEATIDEIAKTITIDTTILDLSDYGFDGCYVISATYNAPEANQIGNAFINYDGDNFVYSGEQGVVLYEDEPISGYKWIMEGGTDYLLTVGNKKASEMVTESTYDGGGAIISCYYDFQILDSREEDYINTELIGGITIPQLNAPDSEQVDNAKISIVIPHVSSGYTIYTGEEVTITYQSEEIHGYKWIDENDDSGYMVTTEKAEDIYSKADSSFYFVNNGNVSQITGMLLSMLMLNILQFKRTMEEWQWEELKVDNVKWKFGGLYRAYVDRDYIVDELGYGTEDWLVAMLAYETNDNIWDLFDKITVAGLDADTVCTLGITWYDKTNNEWVTEAVSPYLREVENPAIGSEEYDEIKATLLQKREDEFDEKNYIYINGFGVYPAEAGWDFADLSFDYSDMLGFIYVFAPIDEYIEEYPVETEEEPTDEPNNPFNPNIPDIGGNHPIGGGGGIPLNP